MQYDLALKYAIDARDALVPYCEKISIAGSLRRRKPDVKDAELVVIPKYVPAGLFSDGLEVDPAFCTAVRYWRKIKGEPTGKYTQRVLPSGLILDLFIADADNYGAILLIRTGDAEFSKHVMGWILPRRGYQARDGYIWKDGTKLSTPRESDVFALAGMAWIEPCKRMGAIR